jgi:hypothetical protein
MFFNYLFEKIHHSSIPELLLFNNGATLNGL